MKIIRSADLGRKNNR